MAQDRKPRFAARHYEDVAASFRRNREVVAGLGGKGLAARNIVGMYLADLFEDDNPRFDRKRFLQAAEVGERLEGAFE